jgi:hypothetical protein
MLYDSKHSKLVTMTAILDTDYLPTKGLLSIKSYNILVPTAKLLTTVYSKLVIMTAILDTDYPPTKGLLSIKSYNILTRT